MLRLISLSVRTQLLFFHLFSSLTADSSFLLALTESIHPLFFFLYRGQLDPI